MANLDCAEGEYPDQSEKAILDLMSSVVYCRDGGLRNLGAVVENSNNALKTHSLIELN